jgi:hypothetical protein
MDRARLDQHPTLDLYGQGMGQQRLDISLPYTLQIILSDPKEFGTEELLPIFNRYAEIEPEFREFDSKGIKDGIMTNLEISNILFEALKKDLDRLRKKGFVTRYQFFPRKIQSNPS